MKLQLFVFDLSLSGAVVGGHWVTARVKYSSLVYSCLGSHYATMFIRMEKICLVLI